MARNRQETGEGDLFSNEPDETYLLELLHRDGPQEPDERDWLRDKDPLGLDRGSIEPPDNLYESEPPSEPSGDPPDWMLDGSLPPGEDLLGVDPEAQAQVEAALDEEGSKKKKKRATPWIVLTDVGNAERLMELAKKKGELRYVPQWEEWIAYDPKCGAWVRDEGNVAMGRLAIESARALGKEAGKQGTAELRKAVRSWSLRSEDSGRIMAAIRMARFVEGAAVDVGQLDADPWLLQCTNGVLDLRTGKLGPNDPKWLSTKSTGVAYKATAKCPVWKAFLRRVMGVDRSLMAYLQRMIGYCLTGSAREQVLFFHHGATGQNGKGTFLETIQAVMGDYAGTAPRKLLARRRGETHPTEFANLHGKRFVVCNETEEGQEYDDDLLKNLTGGDTITCRRMNQDFWSYRPTHKLSIVGNHKPIVRGDDPALWRRMRLIPWLVRIPDHERDNSLLDKLLAEKEGVLAWAVRGCMAWQRDGLATPEAVKAATEEYRIESDTVGEFFSYCLQFDREARISREQIRRVYETFCDQSGGYLPVGPRRLAQRLRSHGAVDAMVRVIGKEFPVRGWRGVRELTAAERTALAAWSGGRSKEPETALESVSPEQVATEETTENTL